MGVAEKKKKKYFMSLGNAWFIFYVYIYTYYILTFSLLSHPKEISNNSLSVLVFLLTLKAINIGMVEQKSKMK